MKLEVRQHTGPRADIAITQIFPKGLNDLKSTGYNEDSAMSITSDATYRNTFRS